MTGWSWRRGLAGAGAVLALLAPARASAREPAPIEIGCPTSCRLLLEPGRYRLTVEPSVTRRGDQRVLDVLDSAIYRVEGAPRDRRWLGLGLASVGLPLAFGGLGAMLGSTGVDDAATSRQRAWFWGGALALGAGATLVPVGFRLYSARADVTPEAPRFYPEEPAPPPDRPVEAYLPARPHPDDLDLPSGYALVEEPRWGLVTSGALTLAGSYGAFVAASLAMLASDDVDDDGAGYFLIPIVGPAIYDYRQQPEDERGLFTFYGTAPQVTGLALLLIGVSASRSWPVPDARAQVTPWFHGDAGGLAIEGELF